MMEKLRTVLGRFTSGQSDVDELRSEFRDYLREHPDRREAVARWVADSIRIGRLSPALMLTIGDLLSPKKPGATRAAPGARTVPPQPRTVPPPSRTLPPPPLGSDSKPDADATILPGARRQATPGGAPPARALQPGTLKPGATPAVGMPAGVTPAGAKPTGVTPAGAKPTGAKSSEALQPGAPQPVDGDVTLFRTPPAAQPSGEAAKPSGEGAQPSGDPAQPSWEVAQASGEVEESVEEVAEWSEEAEGSVEDFEPPEDTYFPELPPEFTDLESVPMPRQFPTQNELPVSKLRSIDPGGLLSEVSIPQLSNIRPTAEAMAADAEGTARVGDILDNRYKLVMELGRGGMGSVFKALDRNREDFQARNPYIALKCLSEEFRRHPDARLALQRETERAQSLAHENIVKVFDFDYDGPHAYMTMELLEGASLESWLHGPEFLRAGADTKWHIVQQICEALVCAHKHGVVHSDLKPGNIFMCSSGTVKVMDFGIARPAREVGTEKDTTLFDAGKRLGGLTPAYAPLEQWNQDAPDVRDDIYSFACVVYYIYAGVHPRGSIRSKEDLEKSPAPKRIRSLSRQQWDALRRALALYRRDRMPSAQEFLVEFAPRNWFYRYRTSIVASATVVTAAILYFGFRYYEDYAADQSLNSQLWPSREGPTKPLTTEQARDIDDYLYLGKEAVRQARETNSTDEFIALLSRGDNNLLELLRRVRELDPSNPQALSLTQEAAALYEDRARALLSANRPADSFRMVTEGQGFAHTYNLFSIRRSVCRRDAELCKAPPSYN